MYINVYDMFWFLNLQKELKHDIVKQPYTQCMIYR